MFRSIISIIIAIVAAVIGLKILGFIIMLAFGIVLGLVKFIAFVALAVPIYFLVKRKLPK